jgi:hypothetical protein
MQITVGSAPLTVTQLGRYVAPGNAQAHVVTIYNSNSVPVVGGSATINTAGLTSGQFAYVPLSSPVVLWDSGVYYILSTEGGDVWFNDDTVVTTTADAAVTGSAYYNPDLGIQPGGSGFGGTNRPYVPVDFKYNVGAPGGITRRGSVFGPIGADSVYRPTVSTIVTGTVGFGGTWVHGTTPNPGESITYQWIMDGVPISPVLTENPAFGLPWTCDTVALGIADGTHIIYPRILDSSTTSIFERMTQAQTIIVANHGFNNGTQTIPVAATTQNRGVSPRPDFITYTAGNPYPARTPRPIAYTFIAGSNNPALRTDPTLWYGESWCGPRNSEYHTSPELVTTPSGGVYAYSPATG